MRLNKQRDCIKVGIDEAGLKFITLLHEFQHKAVQLDYNSCMDCMDFNLRQHIALRTGNGEKYLCFILKPLYFYDFHEISII